MKEIKGTLLINEDNNDFKSTCFCNYSFAQACLLLGNVSPMKNVVHGFLVYVQKTGHLYVINLHMQKISKKRENRGDDHVFITILNYLFQI